MQPILILTTTAGEWVDMPIPLAMDYDLVAEALGTAAVPLAVGHGGAT